MKTTDTKTPKRRSPKPTMCNCWDETNTKLKEKGFQLSDKLSALVWTPDGPLGVVRFLPLQRKDGAKLKRSDPKTLTMSYCPFCGSKYP